MMRLMMRMMRSLRTRLLRGWGKFGWGRRPEKWPSLVNQPRKAQPRCHRLHHQLHQNKQYGCISFTFLGHINENRNGTKLVEEYVCCFTAYN